MHISISFHQRLILFAGKFAGEIFTKSSKYRYLEHITVVTIDISRT